MLGDGGFYKGSTVLVSGTAGTGKSTLAAQFCDATCRRGERAMYFAFEESEAEIVRNMASVGIDLQQWVDAGLLQFHCFRPSLLGLEAHLFAMQKVVGEFDPAVVVMDPVSDLLRIGTGDRRVGDADPSGRLPEGQGRDRPVHQPQLRCRAPAQADQQIASLVDTWLLVKTMEGNGEHNRVLYVLKSRGMAHSNQIREFLLTDQGIELADVYVGPQGVLTGSARQAQEAKERSDGTARLEDLEQRRVELSGAASRSRRRPPPCGASSRTRPTSSGRLLSHGSTGRRGSGRPARRTGPAPASRRRRADDADREPTVDAVNRRRVRRRVADGDEFWHLRLYVAGQSPKSLHAFANLQAALRGASRRPLRDRDHRPRRAPALAAATTSSPSRRSCAGCPRRCARSSATSPTPSACSSASGSSPSAATMQPTALRRRPAEATS